MKFNFKDKNVLVTGSGSGLGKCIAEEFAKAGANIVVVDIKEERAEKVATDIESVYGVKTIASNIDVSKYKDFDFLVEKVLKKWERIDILINSAGICIMDSTEAMDEKTIASILDINLKGTIYGCKAVLPHMQKNKYGKIVNMSSIAAKLCLVGSTAYSASKAGVIAATTCLAREYATDNINVNCILPGIIRTSMWEGMLDDMTKDTDNKRDEVFDQYIDMIPQKRPQEPIDIAHTALFLCSDEAKAVTGQNIGVDGGHTF